MANDLTLRGKKRSELIGYADPMVVHPGDSIQFMVSTEFSEYEAKLVRLIHGDENPEGPGFKTEAVVGFSETLKELSEGEIHERLTSFDLEQTRDDYWRRIYNKTASLFSTAAQSGAILSNLNEEYINAFYKEMVELFK